MKNFWQHRATLPRASFALADIHEPPKSRYTKARKPRPGVSTTRLRMDRNPHDDARWQATAHGTIHRDRDRRIFYGIQRAGARLKYGFYEVINFQRPLYKDSYRPPMPDIDYLSRSAIRGIPSPDRFNDDHGLHPRAHLVIPSGSTALSKAASGRLFLCFRPDPSPS